MEYIRTLRDGRRVYGCVNQVERVKFACQFGPAEVFNEGKFMYVIV
jgi:hypothetical protein